MKTCYIFDVDEVLIHHHQPFLDWCKQSNIIDIEWDKHIEEFNSQYIHEMLPIHSSQEFIKTLNGDDVYLVSAAGTSEKVRTGRLKNLANLYPNIKPENVFLINFSDSKKKYILEIMNSTNYAHYVFVDDREHWIKETSSITNLHSFLYTQTQHKDFNTIPKLSSI